MSATYSDFIAQKRKRHTPSGFACDHDWPDLFPHQRPIVRWALRMGKAAIFLDTGLGKTLGYLAPAAHEDLERAVRQVGAPLVEAVEADDEAGLPRFCGTISLRNRGEGRAELKHVLGRGEGGGGHRGEQRGEDRKSVV